MTRTIQLLEFYKIMEKSKTVMRHSYTSNVSRQESTAEHSWLIAIIAMTLFHELDIAFDQLKVLKMVLLHDVGEIITTDIPAFEVSERQNNKKIDEAKAIKSLFKGLPGKTRIEFTNLWNEFEARETIEAKIAQALDKMEVIIQHNIADFSTWDQGDFNVHPLYRNDYFDFHAFIRKLRDEVEIMSATKVVRGNELERIDKTFHDHYKKLEKKGHTT